MLLHKTSLLYSTIMIFGSCYTQPRRPRGRPKGIVQPTTGPINGSWITLDHYMNSSGNWRLLNGNFTEFWVGSITTSEVRNRKTAAAAVAAAVFDSTAAAAVDDNDWAPAKPRFSAKRLRSAILHKERKKSAPSAYSMPSLCSELLHKSRLVPRRIDIV